MSDTDAPDDGGDDGGFDKEAEREKLREQYESDQKRRGATQQMSDLLLKGATMTNQHCEECGSPIFRYEGEAFCPTCAGTRDAAAGEDAGGEGAQQQAGAQQQSREGQQPQQSAGGSQHAQGAADADGERSGSPQQGGLGGPEGELDDEELETARARLDDRVDTRSPSTGRGTGSRRPPATGDSPVRQGEAPSMAQSRASLRRAIVSLSEQAAQTDDPNHAHDLLKGAREASEALAALEGTTGV